MRCVSPLQGFKARQVNPSGKRSVVFERSEGFHDLPVTVPCGRCVACRLERSRQWAMRCMHEAQLHEENCFVTLTYADEFLPEFGSLDRKAFPLFMKRLRKAYNGRRIAYYHCGEYGDRFGRPHYHSCLFGFDFRDKRLETVRGDFPVYRSAELERLWPFGRSEVGTFSFEAAAYVARYVMKKAIGEESPEQCGRYDVVDYSTGEVVARREREYATMSRRPAIGKGWYERYKNDVYPRDGVVVRGKLVQPPKYYDGLYELEGRMRSVKARRKRKVNWNVERGENDMARKVNLEAQAKLFSRELS